MRPATAAAQGARGAARRHLCSLCWPTSSLEQAECRPWLRFERRPPVTSRSDPPGGSRTSATKADLSPFDERVNGIEHLVARRRTASRAARRVLCAPHVASAWHRSTRAAMVCATAPGAASDGRDVTGRAGAPSRAGGRARQRRCAGAVGRASAHAARAGRCGGRLLRLAARARLCALPRMQRDHLLQRMLRRARLRPARGRPRRGV